MDRLKTLVTSVRRRPTTIDSRTLFQESQSDLGRVVFSAAFRRLQRKAQVFPLETNAAVRSRLTHSLEVAFVGRLLAVQSFERLKKERNLDSSWDKTLRSIPDFVETGCLVHDIGNPPFGHFGEHAIQKWFQLRCNSQDFATDCGVDYDHPGLQDFLKYDGNAQGFRILTGLQWLNDHYGLNLTCTQLATMVKYPRSASDSNVDFPHSSNTNKIGYFYSEKVAAQSVWLTLGLSHYERHPLVYLVEAADDIAYCISDIDDGIEKRIIRGTDLIQYMKSEAPENTIISHALRDPSTATFSNFKVHLTRNLSDCAVEGFVESFDDIIRPDACNVDIWKNSADSTQALELLKKFARSQLYVSPEAQNPELAGYRIISGLLDSFKPLLDLPPNSFLSLSDTNSRANDLERRLYQLLPDNYIKLYRHNSQHSSGHDEFIHRAHLIVDYISGMTDSFALEVFQRLQGIRL